MILRKGICHITHTKTVSSKTGKQKMVLTETLQQAHKRFLTENPTIKVSLSHFHKMRPVEVLTVKNQKIYTCLCEYCSNVKFKIEAIISIRIL